MKNGHRIATVEYLRENYSLSKQLFERYFKTEKPDVWQGCNKGAGGSLTFCLPLGAALNAKI